jgi:hypothetical protein
MFAKCPLLHRDLGVKVTKVNATRTQQPFSSSPLLNIKAVIGIRYAQTSLLKTSFMSPLHDVVQGVIAKVGFSLFLQSDHICNIQGLIYVSSLEK